MYNEQDITKAAFIVIEDNVEKTTPLWSLVIETYLVSLVGSSGSVLALLAGGKLSEITVVITLPVTQIGLDGILRVRMPDKIVANIHLMVENLGLASLGLGDQALVENVEDILADRLEFGLNLLAVIADGADVLVGALRLLFLLDRGDDAPRCSPCAYDVLVCD